MHSTPPARQCTLLLPVAPAGVCSPLLAEASPLLTEAPRSHLLQMLAIQRLMGALCFAKRAAAGRPNPYADLTAADLWGDLGEAPPAAFSCGAPHLPFLGGSYSLQGRMQGYTYSLAEDGGCCWAGAFRSCRRPVKRPR